MNEIETKVLEIEKDKVKEKLLFLGAKQTQNTRLVIDWYCLQGISAESHPWYLRVRSNSEGQSEISWKSLPTIVGNTRQSKEININVEDFAKAKLILESVGLVNYAHQEKDRTSFSLDSWNFDVDQYPGMPAYLEIEGENEEHIGKALKLLNLEDHQSISEGERLLIEKTYGLDWYNMRF